MSLSAAGTCCNLWFCSGRRVVVTHGSRVDGDPILYTLLTLSHDGTRASIKLCRPSGFVLCESEACAACLTCGRRRTCGRSRRRPHAVTAHVSPQTGCRSWPKHLRLRGCGGDGMQHAAETQLRADVAPSRPWQAHRASFHFGYPHSAMPPPQAAPG